MVTVARVPARGPFRRRLQTIAVAEPTLTTVENAQRTRSQRLEQLKMGIVGTPLKKVTLAKELWAGI